MFFLIIDKINRAKNDNIYSKDGIIDESKTNAVKFESLQKNICCAASESLSGAYKRESLLKEFLGGK